MLVSKKKKPWIILSFIAPGAVIYSLFLIWQIVEAVRLSTFSWTSITNKEFTGLKNYIWMFRDESFWNSLQLTLVYMVATVIGSMLIGFTFGYLIYIGMRGKNFFRTVYFIPTVLSGVAVSYIWRYLFSPSFGITRGLMEWLGYGANVSPLGVSDTAFSASILVALWSSVGIQIMMFNSAFNNIPEEVLEYASLDGCTGWRLIRHMILPLSWDVVKMIVILQVIGAFRAFDQIFVMTAGGPYHSTEILPMYMYLTAFENNKYGRGNAIAVAIFVISMAITVILRKVLKRDSLV